MNHFKVRGLLRRAAKCVLSAAAAVALIATGLPQITSSAAVPFIYEWHDSSTGESGIQISRSQLKTEISEPLTKNYLSSNFKSNNVNYLNTNGYRITATPGKLMSFKCTVGNVSEEEAKKFNIYLKCYSKQYGAYNGFAMGYKGEPEKKTVNGVDTYSYTFRFVNFGDYFDLSSRTPFTPVTDAKTGKSLSYITNMTLIDDPNYVVVKTTAPKGYSSFVAAAPLVKTKNGLPRFAYIDWSENVCMYINSLSNMTGIKKDLVFYDSDGYGSCNNNMLEKSYYSSVSSVSICGDSTAALRSDLLDWDYKKPVLTYQEVHELSHVYGMCYKVCTNSTEVYEKYNSDEYRMGDKVYFRNNFANYYGLNGDDVYANARGLAAIQHCKQLHSLNIINSAAKTSDKRIAGTYKDFHRLYMKDLNDRSTWYRTLKNTRVYGSENDSRAHWFCACLVDIAVKENNWNALKQFFSGEKPSTETHPAYFDKFASIIGRPNYFKNTDMNICKKNYINYSIFEHTDKENGVKLANITYKLYKLYNPQDRSLNAQKYEQFIKKYFNDANFTGRDGVPESRGTSFLLSLMQR